MLEPIDTTARFEHFEVTVDVGADVSMWISERVPHAGLRREMDDPIDLGMFLDERGECATLGKLQPVEREIRRASQLGKTRLFKGYRVIIIEIVDADHPVPAAQ